MHRLSSRLLRTVQIIGFGCLVVSIPNIVGEIAPLLENDVADINKSVLEERVKLDIPDQVKITVRAANNIKSLLLRALTQWQKGESDNIIITFYNDGAKPSIVRHEVYHAYRVSKLKNLDPNGGFLMKRREEALASIYALTGWNLAK